MDDFVSRIKKRAEDIEDDGTNLDCCLWSEQIPQFYRRETDGDMTAQIQRHLENCEECATLLMALAIQQPPKPDFSWIKRGALSMLESAVSFVSGSFVLQPSMRSGGDEYRLSEKNIELPDESILYMRVVKQGNTKVVTTFLENGNNCRFDLFDDSETLVKSIDDAKQFKFEMPQADFSLVIGGRFKINVKADD